MTDEELVIAFEHGRLPDGGFHHEQHVRVAWIYLGREPLIPALARFSAALKRFAVAQDQPGLYHETITVAFFLLIEDRVARRGRGADWDAFAAANPDLLSRRPSLLARYYSADLLMSPAARARFVWPDLMEHASMTTPPNRPEVWQRGPVPGVDAVLMPVAHSLLQVQEDLEALASRVPPEHVWIRPGGAGSIAFHVRHVGGSIDRLLTYARGEPLSRAQRLALVEEGSADEPLPSLHDLVADAVRAIERAIAQVRETSRDEVFEPRTVGRAGLPSTTIGLLFHAAEHATRHAGQAITTALILGGMAQERPPI